MSFQAKIIIIGAGPSGIAAATKLFQHGFQNITILEAQNRIGGRIYTAPFGDSLIDLGAQWCHGEKGNVVFDSVKDMNVLDSSGRVFIDYQCIRSNGEVVPEELSKRLKEILKKADDDGDKLLKDYDRSLGAYQREYFLNALKKPMYSDIDKDIAMEFLDVYQKFAACYEGAKSIYDVSGKGYLDYVSCEGDNVLNWKEAGYVKLLHILMESDGNNFGVLDKRIFLNKEVNKVQWNKEGSIPIKLSCADGEKFEVDHVISTISLGVLKHNLEELFEPQLPEINTRAIKGLGFGTYNKVFIKFPRKWWDDKWLGFALHWREEDLKELRKGKFAWLEGVVGFYIVRHHSDVLFSRVSGESALYVETLPKSEQIEGMMYLLKTFLKRSDIPQPIDFIITKWNSNPYSRGSYSHRSMETEMLQTKAADLAQPVLGRDGRPLMMFAGEATHDHFYSTVHGAVESGWREADRLLKYYSD